ncbi:MAG: FUSC family protein [Myxococcales bacterium]|nr:FUSC family protein [Myxococcales bacterium]
MLVLADPMHLALKAGVASALAVVMCRVLGLDDSLSAGFVALACVSPSAYAGLRNGLLQLGGSVLGSVVAGAPLLVWPALHGSPWALIVSMTVAVLACLALGLSSAYFVSGFTVLYLHLLPYPSAVVSVSERLGAVLIGVVVATVVNTAISAIDGERIAARRVARVQREVGLVLTDCAEAIRGGSSSNGALFGRAFGAVAALRADLADAAHENLFPGATRARASASRGLRAADALEACAHLAKEMSLIAEEAKLDPALLERVASVVAVFGATLRGEAPRAASIPEDLADVLNSASEPVLGSAIRRLGRATEAAVAAAPSSFSAKE